MGGVPKSVHILGPSAHEGPGMSTRNSLTEELLNGITVYPFRVQSVHVCVRLAQAWTLWTCGPGGRFLRERPEGAPPGLPPKISRSGTLAQALRCA